MTQQEMKVTL